MYLLQKAGIRELSVILRTEDMLKEEKCCTWQRGEIGEDITVIATGDRY